MRNKVVKILASAVAAAIMLSGCGVMPADAVSGNEAMEEVSENKIYLAGDDVEFNIRPQDDFYGYINAESLWNTSVEYGQGSAGSFTAASMVVDEQLDKIIDEIVKSDEAYAPGTAEYNIREYYKLYKDGKITDKAIFDELFARIDNTQSIDELLMLSGELRKDYGTSMVYEFNIASDDYNPTENAIALVNASACAGSLEEVHKKESGANGFRDVLTNLIQGLGYNHDDAESKATDITYMWLDIANNTDFDSLKNMEMDKVCNPYTLEELGQLIPVSDINGFIEGFGVSSNALNSKGFVYVYDPVQAETIKSVLTEENLEKWQLYTKCAVLSNYTSVIPQEYSFADVHYDEIDDKGIYENIKTEFYGDLGHMYKEKYYTEEYQEYMARMEADMKQAYVKMIQGADWLSQDAKDSFTEKFNNITFYFGGADESQKEIKNIIGNTILETKLNLQKYNMTKLMDQLLKPVDHEVWSMGAQEVNACYVPNNNCIYITRAIMSDPFFDIDKDYYSNLGGLGTVICHELSHAFDSHGVKYDANGMYRPEWISAEDDAAFQEKVAITDAHYDEYALLEVYHVDGEKTVAENLADIGGVQCVLSLANTKEDYEKIFESYAVVWKTLYRNKDIIMNLKMDVHSPSLVRVNAVLSCFDEFYETYDVKEGDGMYIAPEKRINRW